MAHLYLIRHGKPAFPDERKRCIGVTDVSLSEEGHEQMAGLKDFVRRADIKRIYVSPLLRSISSGQILSNGQIPIYVKENLSELHMGAWEGLTFDEIRQTWPADYARRREEYADFAIPGGETFSQCQLRAVAAYREILSEAENENIAIVGHAGFFRALISFLEGRDLNRLMDIPMPYAGVYEWDIGPNLER